MLMNNGIYLKTQDIMQSFVMRHTQKANLYMIKRYVQWYILKHTRHNAANCNEAYLKNI